jgi:ATP-dependent Clp protease protease subunit
MGAKLDADEATLSLSGTVGFLGYDDHFRHSDVANSLAMIGRDKDVTIKINSGGGVATEGAAIYSALKDHKGKVTVHVEGVAASAASLIAMAGDERVMGPGSIMMIHDPATITIGTAQDHSKTVEYLDALGDAYASIYAEATGLSVDDARALMRSETWMKGEDAVDQGFATSFKGKGKKAEPTAFMYAAYQNAPQELVALASTRGWSRTPVSMITDTSKEVAMGDKKEDDPKMLHHNQSLTTLKKKNDPPKDDPEDDDPEDDPAKGGDGGDDEDEEDDNGDKKFGKKKAPPTSVAADIAEACMEAGVPAMTAALIREGVDLATAKERITAASDIRSAVADASKRFPSITMDLADKFIANGDSIEKVRATLFEKIAATQSHEVSPHVNVKEKDTKQQSSAVWDKAVENINARK